MKAQHRRQIKRVKSDGAAQQPRGHDQHRLGQMKETGQTAGTAHSASSEKNRDLALGLKKRQSAASVENKTGTFPFSLRREN